MFAFKYKIFQVLGQVVQVFNDLLLVSFGAILKL